MLTLNDDADTIEVNLHQENIHGYKKNDKIQFGNLSKFCITWKFQELALHQSLGIWKI